MCDQRAVPTFWECQRCGACCRWPGQVKVTEAEVDRIAQYLGVDNEEFIRDSTRLRPDRKGLALLDQKDGSCVYYQNGLCAIQKVKPQQCRDFPNLWSYPEARKECEAIPHELEEGEYRARIREATGRELGED